LIFLAIGFLPGKTRPIYKEFFGQIKESLIQQFGGTGVPKTVLMDEEIGAQTEVKAAFDCEIRSCYFHYTKAVISWIKNHGLKKAMGSEVFNSWLNGLLGK